MKHTPLSWQWYWRLGDNMEADCGIFHEKREGLAYAIARCPKYTKEDQWKSDAAFIVKACNSHYDLLEACKALVRQEDWQGEDIDPLSPVGKARAAIAKAESQ